MFHFTKDIGAFGRLSLELLAADPKLIELKNIGVDMESAIYQSFNPLVPGVHKRSQLQVCLSMCDRLVGTRF